MGKVTAASRALANLSFHTATTVKPSERKEAFHSENDGGRGEEEAKRRRPSSHPLHRLDFLPSPSSVLLRPPPSPSLSFHAIGQKTSSSAAPASLESEAARRRFGEGKADGEGRRETSNASAALEGKDGGVEGEEATTKVESKCGGILACHRVERRRRSSQTDGCPKCETEALSDISDCNCRREREGRKEHAPLSKIRRKRRKERKR